MFGLEVGGSSATHSTKDFFQSDRQMSWRNGRVDAKRGAKCGAKLKHGAKCGAKS